MRFIIYGAGGIGGSIGARLHLAGERVCLIARGKHFEAINKAGLSFHSPKYHETLPIECVQRPQDLTFTSEDVVILCMKSQHTDNALRDLQMAAPDDTPVICCQNGVSNERMAIRRFKRVYGMVVWVPAEHLVPGEVINFAEDKAGNLDAGCYPQGVDDLIGQVTSTIDKAGFSSTSDPVIMEHKYAKLLVNLANALDATLKGRVPKVASLLQTEARACLAAAQIAVADLEKTQERRGKIRGGAVEGFSRHGSSTYQSFLRNVGDTEVDYMNGEIVQLGRLHNIPTPANIVAQRLTTQLLRHEFEPRSITEQQVLHLIEKESNLGTETIP